jgi:hypothetical protein
MGTDADQVPARAGQRHRLPVELRTEEPDDLTGAVPSVERLAQGHF